MKTKNKYAIIAAGGSQHLVAEGDELILPRIHELNKTGNLSFSQVLLVKDDKTVQVGQPTIDGAVVKARSMEDFLGPKVRVATYKAKSRHRKVSGHRDHLTRVKIESISVGKKV